MRRKASELALEFPWVDLVFEHLDSVDEYDRDVILVGCHGALVLFDVDFAEFKFVRAAGG